MIISVYHTHIRKLQSNFTNKMTHTILFDCQTARLKHLPYSFLCVHARSGGHSVQFTKIRTKVLAQLQVRVQNITFN